MFNDFFPKNSVFYEIMSKKYDGAREVTDDNTRYALSMLGNVRTTTRLHTHPHTNRHTHAHAPTHA